MAIVNSNNFIKNAQDYFSAIMSDNDIIKIATDGGNIIMLNEKEYKQLVRTAGKNKKPNKETIEAMQEIENMIGGIIPSNPKSVGNFLEEMNDYAAH
jgi:adenosine/AMP kinase